MLGPSGVVVSVLPPCHPCPNSTVPHIFGRRQAFHLPGGSHLGLRETPAEGWKGRISIKKKGAGKFRLSAHRNLDRERGVAQPPTQCR